MHVVLTVAGSDPTGGAGLQADLKVLRTFGVCGVSVVSAITAQNTMGVEAIFPVERIAFERQLRVLLADMRPVSVKVGMLYSAWTADILAHILHEHRIGNIVVDPVTVSSSGTSLVDDGVLDMIRTHMFPISRVITPNIYEAAVLTGLAIENTADMKEAARALKSMGPEVVVITGGHLEGRATDLFFDGTFHAIEGEKLRGEFHGTGCAFSSSVAALLANGYAPLDAVRKAKSFVTDAMKKAYYPGKGMALLNF